MKEVTFTYVQTRYEGCRFDFYIKDNIMFVKSNYFTAQQCLCCGDEKWIDIIKDRGNWEYFHKKIANSKYEHGNPFSERERKCFEQLVSIIKKS